MAKLTKKQKDISDMYVTYFGVAADTATIKEYTKFTTTKVLAEIKKDAQISQIGFSNEEVVNNTFQNIFGRNATPQELNKHLKALEKNNKINVNSIVKNAKSADKAVIKNKKDIAKFVAENGGAKLDLSKISAANKIDVKSLTSLTDLQTKLDALPDNDYTISAYDGKDFILTAGVDVGAKFVGTSKNDTFHATETTLQAGDIINGHTGTDRLKISDNTGKTFTGFEAKNIEVIEVTSDNGATTVDLTYTTEATKLVNANSSQNVTFENIQEPIKTVELVKVTGGDTEVNFDVDAGLEGTADSIEVVLNNVKGVNGKAESIIRGTYKDALAAAKQKIETVNVKVTGTNSVIKDIEFGQTTVNIAGNKDLTIDNPGTTLTGTTKIDASAFTGNLTLGALDSLGNKDVSVIGGSGNDTVSFVNGYDAGDSFNGNGGRDTIIMTQALATLGAGAVSNVEVLKISNAGVSTTIIDMDNFVGVDTVDFVSGITTGNTATVKDAVSGINVVVDMDSVNTEGTLVVALKTDGASDVVNVTLNNSAAVPAVRETMSGVTVNDAETLNLTVSGDAVTVTTLSATDATTLNITTAADLTITTLTNTALTKIDATKSTADVSLTSGALTSASTVDGGLGDDTLNMAAAGAAVVLSGNAGNDILTGSASSDTINGGTGNDTITGNAGKDTLTGGAGVDTFIYTTATDSNGVNTDTITDFATGSDILKITNDDAIKYLGEVANSTILTTALTGTAGQAALDKSTNTLYIDLNGDGVLNSSDMSIILTSVTTLSQSDFVSDVSAASITGSANNDTINATIINGGTLLSLAGDDTITTVGGVATNTYSIRAGAGNDTITLDSTAGVVETILFEATAAANGVDTITGFEFGAGKDKLDVNLGVLDASKFLSGAIASSLTLAAGTAEVLSLTDIQTLTSANFGAAASATVIQTTANQSYFVIADVAGDADSIQNLYSVVTDATNVATVTLVGTINEGPVHTDNFA